VLAWRLSNTMDVSFCLSTLKQALARFGRPEIFNTDQGSQFTSAAFTGALTEAGVAISMDGRGRWMDNVFIERLWCSLKYEDVYFRGYADGRKAARGIAEWVAFYNRASGHPSVYVIELNKLCSFWFGPAGRLVFRWARSAIDLAVSVMSSARAKIQGRRSTGGERRSRRLRPPAAAFSTQSSERARRPRD
jgi:integrase-like protein